MGKLMKWLRGQRRSKEGDKQQNYAPLEGAAVPSFPDGVKVLHDCPDATVDICFVHGLTGDRDRTWTAPGQASPWPKTLLPSKLKKARILTYGYDAYVVRKGRTGAAGSGRLIDHATNLLHDLTADRASCNASLRPLILIAHSLGGLVCKEALLLSRNNPETHLRGIFNCVKGIMFMATPHRGSWMAAWAEIPASAIGFVGPSTNTSLLNVLGTDSQMLESVQVQFWSMVRELREDGRPLEVTCFFEEVPLPVFGLVVSKESATLEGYNSITIAADHRDLVRFVSAEETGFKRVLGELVRWEAQVRNPPPGVLSRFNSVVSVPTAYAGKNQTIQQTIVQATSEDMPKPPPACLRSLAFPKMQDRSHDIDRAVPGTCEWLLQHETYKSWIPHDRGLLWIKGKPGSGKSTLLRYALDNHKVGADDLVLSFFFHARGEELQKTPLGFLRSVLHQLLGQAPGSLQDLVDVFEKRCKEVGTPGENWHWHQAELQRFLESALQKVLEVRSVWLFIDALDECGKKNAVFLLRWFKSLLQKLPTTPAGSQCHICITCRHYPILDWECEFNICPEDQNKEDISTYVRSQLSESRELAESSIPASITENASGVFMWARLVVERILDLDHEGETLGTIMSEFLSIPPNLDLLYQDLIQDMGSASAKLVQWICLATRPLSLDELRWAMVLEADSPERSLRECQARDDFMSSDERLRKKVQTLSCGLAEVTPSSAVQFVHQSVADFFRAKGLSVLNDNSTPAMAVGMAHFRLARICLSYIAMEEISQPTSETPDDDYDCSFLRYALHSWIPHAKLCEATQAGLLGTFSWLQSDLLDAWVLVWDAVESVEPTFTDEDPPSGTTIFHLLARHGLSQSLRAILQEGSPAIKDIGDIDTADGFYRTPLSWAAINGHEAAATILLESRLVEVDSRDNFQRTPLLLAAKNGHEAAVNVLLSWKADTESKDSSGETPLFWAADKGHESIVKILLEAGAQANLWDRGNSGTPLLQAADNGHESVVKLLLASNVDVNATNRLGHTPLMMAAWKRNPSVVKLLLAVNGIDVDTRDHRGQSPLSVAARNGCEASVKLLLDFGGVKIDSRDVLGRTPFSQAAEHGNEGVVRLLMSTGGVDIDAPDDRGRTPLSYAAGSPLGRDSIVELLLATGSVNLRSVCTQMGWPPWRWARKEGRKGAVGLLEKAEAGLKG